MTNHFTFFESYYEAVEHLDADIKAEFFDLLFKYALRNEEPEDTTTPIVKALFMMAKPNLDKSKQRREAGKQGGSKAKQTPSKAKQTPSDKEKDKDKDKDKEKEFSFTLASKQSFDNLSSTYYDKLEEYINNSVYTLSYDDFAGACLANGYKYKNFSLAYINWAKKSFNNTPKEPEEKVQLWG